MTTQRSAAIAEPYNRLSTVRRFYFYLVTLIAYVAALFAFDALVERLVDVWIQDQALFVIRGPGFVRNTVAATASVLAVAAPIFLIHWGYIQRHVDEPGERAAALRKFHFSVASAFALGFALVHAHDFLGGVAALAFGLPPSQSLILPSAWLYHLVVVVAASALLYYWQAVARADGDYGAESGLAATWRRLFLAGVALVGLALIVFGSADIIGAGLHRLLDRVHPAITGTWFPREMGDGISLLLLGLVTARTAWQTWRSITLRQPAEEGSIVKRLFLYLAVVGGAIAALVPAAILVRRLLLWSFAGFDSPVVDVLDEVATVVGFIPAGVWLWARHWRLLQETGREYETPAALTLRRIYYYAVAATGLVLVWLGLVNVAQVILDLIMTSDQIKVALVWQKPLATGLSLLVVGAPVWALHWRAVQRVARQDDEAGAVERGSLPRRIYLYGVAFAGAILILFYFAQVIYRLLLYALGDRTVAFFSSELAEDLARSAIAALLWAVHLLALRADAAMPASSQTSAPHERRRQRLAAQVAVLEAELASARAELAALDEED